MQKNTIRISFEMKRRFLPLLFLALFLFMVSSAAAQELRSKALQGDAFAQLQLGERYAERGNLTLAVYWFRKAAEQNIPLALYRLAVCMEHGWGTPKNIKFALECYARLEKAGMNQAAFRRAMLLWNGADGEIEPQKKWAMRQLSRLSASYAPARLEWIRILWSDAELRLQRGDELRELAEKALQETPNDPEIVLFNARLNRDGIGAVGNPQKAVELFQRAAALGSQAAKVDLASCLEAGYGCRPDPSKAFELVKEAALAGVPEAQIRYGEYLLAGDYCPHDPVLGETFIRKGKSASKR